MRRFSTALLLVLAPSAAVAEGTMPQMDFADPLTSTQILWMVVILVVLYLLLSRWGLPEIGKVLENRAEVIARDLAAARAAKQAAETAVAQMNATMAQARSTAQAEVAKAVADAKAKAEADAKVLNARLEAKLSAAEAQIAEAEKAALAAIRPVAAEAASSILLKLTGSPPAQTALAPCLDEALAARKVA